MHGLATMFKVLFEVKEGVVVFELLTLVPLTIEMAGTARIKHNASTANL